MRTAEKSRAWSMGHTEASPEVSVKKIVGPGRPPVTDDIAEFAMRIRQERSIRWPQIAIEWLELHPNETRPVEKKDYVREAHRRFYGDKTKKRRWTAKK